MNRQTLEENIKRIEAHIFAFKKLIREQKRLLKDGCRDEAMKLDKAIEIALLDILGSAMEAELAMLEGTAEKKDLKLDAPWKARSSR